ncbi:mechanosensitive ion channel family protein [Flectobacillus longus]|uniref:mechanosensitive ion channel family protein n=1 Tax=Flectobacillus longus TaxID=2984207 RepID=UPI0024B6A4D3|nr:mechanosensitive ion channel [Flectobacillus longus]MDI9879397.1 mechanosensitive ion channel [Flectobacillus longus]
MPNIQDILIDTFRKLLEQLTGFVPKLLGASILLIVGSIMSKLVSRILKTALEKSGFDRLGDKLNKIDVIARFGELKLSLIVSKVLQYFIMLVFITASTETLGMQVLTDMVASLVNLIPKLIASAILLFAGLMIADTLKNTVINLCNSFKIDSAKLLGNIVFFFFFVIALIASLKQAGIETSLLESSFNLIIGGVVLAFAIGYGFASRDVLMNILSNFYSKNKFKEGQVIEVNGVKGTIVSFDTTSLTLQTGETQTILPLNVLQKEKIEIFTHDS